MILIQYFHWRSSCISSSDFKLMNLSSLATVVEFSQLYLNEYTKLDLLINNAGMLQQILYLFIKKEIKRLLFELS